MAANDEALGTGGGDAFRVDRADAGPEVVLKLSGRLALDRAGALRADILSRLEGAAGRVRFDFASVETVDSGSMAVIVHQIHELQKRGVKTDVSGLDPTATALLDLLDHHIERPPLHAPPPRIGILDQFGQQTIALLKDISEILDYLGDVTASAFAAIRSPSSIHWRDVSRHMERAGADGLPIVFLISFLVGLVMAFQGAAQLENFGATQLVAAGVALSFARELGPLMTAIIISGRSGAAFAAEIGTMKVSEEVDALTTMGIDPIRHLVFPRIIALILVMPLLTLFADLVGIGGGFLVGVFGYDLNPTDYIQKTRDILQMKDVISGVAKSVVFGFAISSIACERGLATRGGAEGVGLSTTSSVVTCLFHIVAIDAMFTILFQLFGVYS